MSRCSTLVAAICLGSGLLLGRFSEPIWAQDERPQPTPREPILFDTDIGADIDDAFALGLALGSFELDVRGITTVGDSTQKKAMLACRLLTVTGRRNTRVAAGKKPQPPRPLTNQYKYYYHPDVLFNRTTKPVDQSAAEFLYRRAKAQPGQVTLVAVGPLTNVARLLETHADAKSLLRRVVLLESNLALDVAAARHIFASGVPLIVLPSAACRDLKLDDAGVGKVFRPGTPLSRQIETMYQMWDQREPSLAAALAVAVSFDDQQATLEEKRLTVDDSGALKPANDARPVAVVTGIDRTRFAAWYAERMASLVSPSRRPSRLVEQGPMPHRVHVAEDFENDIERFWWMSGKPETKTVPAGSRRACRGVLTHDFDDLLMMSRNMYAAVIFNPVPGPPMGKNSRLSFRYWLKGTDTIRVQIYSLTNGYHRQLVVKGLPQGAWKQATVDMTQARRPDGTGGPLGEHERIDDIQFYIDPDGELLIDDIVLFDAAAAGEKRPFPKRILFSGLFDTGKQGQHWPGDFEIVANAGNFWRAAKSVIHEKTRRPWIRLQLRGQRRLGPKTRVRQRYRLAGADQFELRLVNSQSGKGVSTGSGKLASKQWAETEIAFDSAGLPAIDEVHYLLPAGAELFVDDVLVFEPAAKQLAE